MSIAGPIPPDMSMRNERFKLAHLAGILSRLRRDRRGNVLAITAAALIPLVGLVGGGLDLSRIYLVQTRLQHACDAGALAGRKAMGGGTWAQANGAPQKTANEFFDGNYETGVYGSENMQRTFTESAGRVTGAAQADVPMTLMKIFDQPTKTLAVTCDAEMRLPNTDVMFVLDVTGSMNDPASPGDPKKIVTLKQSVKCFYEIVARLDTNANCAGGAPSGGTDPNVQIRFGFMPYSMNVNVGRLLPTSYFADRWKYQSREARWWIMRAGVSVATLAPILTPNVAAAACTPTPTATVTAVINGDVKTEVGTTSTVTWTKLPLGLLGTCARTNTTSTRIYDRKVGIDIVPTVNDQFIDWHYAEVEHDVSSLKNGTGWNSAATVRTGASGALTSINWQGCIEERRPTVKATSYSPIPKSAKDLNIDLVPDQNDTTTLWGPALSNPPAVSNKFFPETGLVYMRKVTAPSGSFNNVDPAETYAAVDFRNDPSAVCPREARKLQTWSSANDFDQYVDSLTTGGTTYHDIGMLWGARFMSPTGIFAAQNATTPKGGEILRHMIFMTDGDAQSAPCDYNAYGVAFFDQRTTTDVGNAGNCGSSRDELEEQINARMDALCTEVKNRNITLWVIGFGDGTVPATDKRLKACASEGRYFSAKNSAALQKTFADIANQISQLRLTN